MNRVGIDPANIQRILDHLRAVQAQASGGAANAAGSAAATKAASATPATQDFSSVLKTSLEQVNSFQLRATEATRQFELDPKNTNLHDVMIAVQKAQVSFQATVQFRNKVVQAYQDIMNLQI
jgi:flagellar hook-basal body complex protein FliE